MRGIVLLIGMALGLVNLVAPIVGFVWTAVLGEWSTFFLALGGVFSGVFLISMLMMPGMLLGGIAASSLEQGRRNVGWGFTVASLLWTLLAVSAWCYLVQIILIGRAGYSEYWAFGLLAYGVSLSPLAKMARADGNNPYTQFTWLGISLATTLHVFYSIVEEAFNPEAFVIIYGAVIAIVMICSLLMAAAERRSY